MAPPRSVKQQPLLARENAAVSPCKTLHFWLIESVLKHPPKTQSILPAGKVTTAI
jgi:hypothetical protein